jgi:response regulator RpfG family c-di-GMP phosphodiesterase
MQYLSKESGRHFDPALVAVMLELEPALTKIHAQHRD